MGRPARRTAEKAKLCVAMFSDDEHERVTPKRTRGPGQKPRCDARNFVKTRKAFSERDARLWLFHLMKRTGGLGPAQRNKLGELQNAVKAERLDEAHTTKLMQESLPHEYTSFAVAFCEWLDMDPTEAAQLLGTARGWEDGSSCDINFCEICKASIQSMRCDVTPKTVEACRKGTKRGGFRVCIACRNGYGAVTCMTVHTTMHPGELQHVIKFLRCMSHVTRITPGEASREQPRIVRIDNLPPFVPETVEENFEWAKEWGHHDMEEVPELGVRDVYTTFTPTPIGRLDLARDDKTKRPQRDDSSDRRTKPPPSRTKPPHSDDFTLVAQSAISKLRPGKLQAMNAVLHVEGGSDLARHTQVLVTPTDAAEQSGTGLHWDSAGAWNVATGIEGVTPPGDVLAVWLLLKPEHIEESLSSLCSKVGMDRKWLGSLQVRPSLEAVRELCAALGDKVVYLKQKAGDAVRVPASWGHVVFNMAPNAKLALEVCDSDEEVACAAWGRNVVRRNAREALDPRIKKACDQHLKDLEKGRKGKAREDKKEGEADMGHTVNRFVLPDDYYPLESILWGWWSELFPKQ